MYKKVSKKCWKKQGLDVIKAGIILGGVSILFTLISLYYSTSSYGIEMFKSYLQYPKLIILNIVPVFCIACIIYLIANSLAISSGITGAVVLLMTWINYFKLQFRDDPFLFGDIFIAAEAKNMTENFKIRLNGGMLFCIILLVLIVVALHFYKVKLIIAQLRILLLVTCVLISGVLYKTVFTNSEVYDSIENYSLVNRWGETQRFVSRGFIYPFIYSITSAFPEKPDGYNKKQAEELLNDYEYYDIPEEKKVNIVAIMLEAYNDFSKFEELSFVADPYEQFHEIQNQSIAKGELTTNIFAGGTINTERAFLTSFSDIPSMRKKTNSWAWYFKEQGYEVTGRHQCYGWFYNRKNVNKNIGFQDYQYYEEGYEEYEMNTLIREGDKLMLEDIVNDYKNAVSNGKNCFSFSVTYQNHGPYSTDLYYDVVPQLEKKDVYTEPEYNIINNYLDGISKTDEALGNMIDFFEKEEEPVIVVLFGDHNPWLGDNNSVYEMLDINLDIGTEEGFYNYYNTPYVVWANETAKNVINFKERGEDEDISPCFLMNKVFELAGYQGNEYMQYTTEIYENIPIIHSSGYVENEKFCRTLSEHGKEILNQYKQIQYYWKYDDKVEAS